MVAVIEMTGKTFGKLFVLSRAENGTSGQAFWTCRCVCGNLTEVHGVKLRNGHTKSCGCASAVRKTHGLRHSPEYNVWTGMRQRCNDPNLDCYPRYGGRGIKVCDRWQDSFENFYADMGPRPSPDHQLDRVNNDGDYSLENCEWVTRADNCNNRRDNILIEWRGDAFTVPEWARKTGLSKFAIWQRLNVLHWDVERTMTTPVRQSRRRSKAA